MQDRKPKSERWAIVVFVAAGLIVLVLGTLYGKRQPPVAITTGRMQALKKAVLTHAEATGQPPATLAELKLTGEALEDHLGEPFMYSVEGREVKILSYGSDKKPGGWVFKRDFELAFDVP